MVDPRNWEGRVEDNIRRDGQGTRKQRQNVEQVLQKKGRRTGTEYSVVCGVVHEEEAGGEREERKKKKKKKTKREKRLAIPVRASNGVLTLECQSA